MPDIEMQPSARPRHPGDRRLRERDLMGHFTHREAEPEPESEPAPSGDVEPEVDEDAALEAEAQPPAGDPVLERAVEVLKMRSYFEQLSARRAQGMSEVRADTGKAASSEPAQP